MQISLLHASHVLRTCWPEQAGLHSVDARAGSTVQFVSTSAVSPARSPGVRHAPQRAQVQPQNGRETVGEFHLDTRCITESMTPDPTVHLQRWRVAIENAAFGVWCICQPIVDGISG